MFNVNFMIRKKSDPPLSYTVLLTWLSDCKWKFYLAILSYHFPIKLPWTKFNMAAPSSGGFVRHWASIMVHYNLLKPEEQHCESSYSINQHTISRTQDIFLNEFSIHTHTHTHTLCKPILHTDFFLFALKKGTEAFSSTSQNRLTHF